MVQRIPVSVSAATSTHQDLFMRQLNKNLNRGNRGTDLQRNSSAFLAISAVCFFLLASPARAQSPIVLRESIDTNRPYSVRTQTELAGALTLPPTKDKQSTGNVTVNGRSTVSYDERLLSSMPDGASRSIRIYRSADFRRTVADRAQESTIRPNVRRMVVLRRGTREVPFSPDGPLTFGEIDLVRTDVFTPALAGLLPGQAVNIGDRWPAALSAVEELTDLERIEQGGLECQLAAVSTENNRKTALVRFSGTLRGVNQDGPSRQELQGSYSFDLTNNLLASLSLTGVHSLLDGQGKVTGRIEGKFQLHRQLLAMPSELSDPALQNLSLEPNSANTLLVYEGSGVGVRFAYPRRWRVSAEHGRQVTLDDPNGNGILITMEEAGKVPKPTDFQQETSAFITKQKGKVLRHEPPRRLGTTLGEVYQFGAEIEMNNQPARMEYFVVNQAAGGATIAARLLPREAVELRPEIEQLVRSLTFTSAAPIGVRPIPAN
jgi:hypothetical protein